MLETIQSQSSVAVRNSVASATVSTLTSFSPAAVSWVRRVPGSDSWNSSGAGSQRFDREAVGDLRQVVARLTRLGDVAHRQEHLDVRRQQLAALEPVRRRVHQTAQIRLRCVQPSLGDAQEAEPGLGLTAHPAGFAIRLLGRRELPSQAVHLRLLVERAAGRTLPGPTREAVARTAHLGERAPPHTRELHDLCAMHDARAGEGDQLRLGGAPLREHRGPLARAGEGVHLEAGVDDAAIDHSREHGRHVTAAGGEHGFVQQGQTDLDRSLRQERPALKVARAGGETGIAAPFPDARGARGRDMRRFTITGAKLLLRGGKEEVAALDAIARLGFDEALRPPEPARRAAGLSAKQQEEPHPERALGRAKPLVRLQVNPVRALQRSQRAGLFVDEVRGRRQQLQVARRECPRPVGSTQQIVGVSPGTPPIGVAGTLELVSHGMHTARRRSASP
ncbi:MAG: hypothetical protein WKG00_07805 [Polyangiaceae bacterium]